MIPYNSCWCGCRQTCRSVQLCGCTNIAATLHGVISAPSCLYLDGYAFTLAPGQARCHATGPLPHGASWRHQGADFLCLGQATLPGPRIELHCGCGSDFTTCGQLRLDFGVNEFSSSCVIDLDTPDNGCSCSPLSIAFSFILGAAPPFQSACCCPVNNVNVTITITE